MSALELRITDAIAQARGQESTRKQPRNGTLEAAPGVARCGYCSSQNVADWQRELYCRDCGMSTRKNMRALRYYAVW